MKVHPDFVEGNRITGNVKALLDKIAGILNSEEPQNAMALRSFVPADIAADFLTAMQKNDIERAKKIISDKSAAMNEAYNQITVPLDLDEQIEILDFDKMEDLPMNKRELIKFLKDLPKQEIMTADLRAIVGLPENNDNIGQKHLFFGRSANRERNRIAIRKTLNSFADVIANARLVEIEPNTKIRDYSGMGSNQKKRQARKNSVSNYYRFFVPVRINGEICTLVITAEETAGQDGKTAKTQAYEIHTVKNGKEISPVPIKDSLENVPANSIGGTGDTLSIREVLANVKDRNGNFYIKEDGTGNFAPDVTVFNQMSTEDKTLVAYHNISERNLIRALDFGGFPSPSLAVMKADSAYDGFGEITLVGTKDLADPKKRVNVYSKDGYTVTFPSPVYSKPKQAVIRKFREKWESVFDEVGDGNGKYYLGYGLDNGTNLQETADGIKSSLGMQYYYLTKVLGRKYDIPQKDLAPDYRELKRVIWKTEADTLNSVEYEQWADAQLEELLGEKKIKIGSKLCPWTLENVTKYMLKNSGATKEKGLTFSSGHLASAVAHKFTSIKDMHANENKLAGKGSVSEAIEMAKRLGEDYRSKMSVYYKYGHTFNAYDEAMKALSKSADKTGKTTKEKLKSALINSGNFKEDISDEALQAGVDYLSAITDTATLYFEAKPQRAVGINEFAGAVVPADTNPELIRRLKSAGLQVETYDADVIGDRQRAAARIQQQPNVLFQIMGETGAAALDRQEEATIRLDNLNAARQMEKAGKDAKDIKIATGWERGADGKWRYEVQDFIFRADAKWEDMVSGDRNTGDYIEYKKALLPDVIDAPELFSAYPSLKKAWVCIQKLEGTAKGSAQGEIKSRYFEDIPASISLSEDLFKDNAEWTEKLKRLESAAEYKAYEKEYAAVEEKYNSENADFEAIESELEAIDDKFYSTPVGHKVKEHLSARRFEFKNTDKALSTLAHEVQHLIQEIEGFAEGGTAESSGSYDTYRALAGEVEARNVQKRMNMPWEERRQTLLSETEDVAHEDQIFLFQAAMRKVNKSFIQDSNGNINWGHISEVKSDNGQIIPAAAVNMQIGYQVGENEAGAGYVHIFSRHRDFIKAKGYDGIEKAVKDVLTGFSFMSVNESPEGRLRLNLYKDLSPNTGLRLILDLTNDEAGEYYSIISIMPLSQNQLAREKPKALLFSGSVRPHTANRQDGALYTPNENMTGIADGLVARKNNAFGSISLSEANKSVNEYTYGKVKDINRQSIKGSTILQSNGQRIIQLLENADESTFLHEMSHVYLGELKQLAEIAPDSDAGKDYATIMAWAGYKEGASAEYTGTATAREFAGRSVSQLFDLSTVSGCRGGRFLAEPLSPR